MKMNKMLKKGFFLLTAILVGLVAGCGGGGGGGEGGGTPDSGPTVQSVNVAGTWEITETMGGNSCGNAEGFWDQYQIDIAQNGNDLTLTFPDGVYTGSITGDTVTWAGSYPDAPGTVTITDMEIKVAADGTSLSGPASWTWSDGDASCSGTTAISGALVQASLPANLPPLANAGPDQADALTGGAVTLDGSASSDPDGDAITCFWSFSQTPAGSAAVLNDPTTIHPSFVPDVDGTYVIGLIVSDGQASSTKDEVSITAATTQSPPTAPAAPTDLAVADITTSSAQLSWSDNSQNETGFRVEMSSVSNTTGFAEIATVSNDLSSYQVSGLSPSTVYYFRVIAFNAAGASAYSNIAEATTLAPSISVPSPPASLSVRSVSSSKAILVWTDGSSDEDGFELERRLGASGPFTQVATVPAGVTSFTDTGLTPSTAYHYRVRAYNTAGPSAFSNEVSVTTLSTLIAPVLTGPGTATADFTLSWTYAFVGLASSADGYELQESTTSPSTGFVTIDTTRNQGDRQSPKNLSVSPNGAGVYYYRVRAFDEGMFTPWSNVVTVSVSAASMQTVTVFAGADNQMIISSVDSSWADKAFPSAELAVGCNWSYDMACYSNFVCSASTVWFDLPGTIGGKSINRAILRLYPEMLPGDYSRNLNLEVKAISSSWNTNTLTWNTMPNVYTTVVATAPRPVTSALAVEFDITNIVQRWADGTWANWGLLLEGDWESYQNPQFCSETYEATTFESLESWSGWDRRPQVFIEYQ